MINRPRRSLLASAALTASVLALAACSGSSSPATPSSGASSASSPGGTTTASDAPATPGAAKNPYTGIGPVPKNRVVAVKIDDSPAGRPQVNIDKADIVFVEAVEGGLTRLAAVYATTMPSTVGYVRSTRPSDPELLLQFGKITEAYSGGAHDSLPLVRKSGIRSWSNDAGAGYYRRQSHAGDNGYVNLVLNLAQVSAHTNTPRATSIGWTFGAKTTGLRTTSGRDVRTVVTGSYTSGTPVEFRWDGSLRKYVRYIGGVRQLTAAGKPVTATNVVVQSCRVTSHPADTDVNGNPSQFTYTVGSGPVAVFRGGKRINGTWSRPRTSGGTTFRANGKKIPLAPGNTWVVLIRKGVAVSG